LILSNNRCITKMIHLVLADNQPIFRAGTARVLEAEPDFRLLRQCENPAQLLDAIAAAPSAVVLMAQSLDAEMDKVFAAVTKSVSRIILMTDTEGEPQPSVLARLDGLLTRHVSTADLLQCVRRVGVGERTVGLTSTNPADGVSHRMMRMLTQREMQIVGFVVQGFKNRQIADELGTREQVVKNYLRSIYDKTGSSDRLELALFTLHHRLLAQAAAQAVANLVRAKSQPVL
jgi:DNA-binding NarL/FixJ family response regulator